MDFRFGIITPTFQRHRFLPKVLWQVRAQTYPHWVFVLANDGGDSQARRIFERHSGGDPKMHFIETPVVAGDWGDTPRRFAAEFLARLPQPPDYLVFWDDDNAFNPDALRIMAGELERHRFPDLMLMPLAVQLSQIPRPDLQPEQAQAGEVDTGNFVVRAELARAVYGQYLNQPATRATDYRFYDRIRSAGRHRIVLSAGPPIGRYDGLRFFATLRWRLGIPPLGIVDKFWYRTLRRWLRG